MQIKYPELQFIMIILPYNIWNLGQYFHVVGSLRFHEKMYDKLLLEESRESERGNFGHLWCVSVELLQAVNIGLSHLILLEFD